MIICLNPKRFFFFLPPTPAKSLCILFYFRKCVCSWKKIIAPFKCITSVQVFFHIYTFSLFFLSETWFHWCFFFANQRGTYPFQSYTILWMKYCILNIYYHILNEKQVSIKIQKTILNYLNYFMQLRQFRFKATCQTEEIFVPIDWFVSHTHHSLTIHYPHSPQTLKKENNFSSFFNSKHFLNFD